MDEQASPMPMASVLPVVFTAETLQATIACLSMDVFLQKSAFAQLVSAMVLVSVGPELAGSHFLFLSSL